MIDYIIVAIGLLLPLFALGKSFRFAASWYVFLIPLYMYLKSTYDLLTISGRPLQWPTLTKDVVGVTLLILFFTTIVSSAGEPGNHWTLPKAHWRVIGVFTLFAVWAVGCNLWLGTSVWGIIIGLRPYLLYQILGVILGWALLKETRSWNSIVNGIIVGCAVIGIIALAQKYVYHRFFILPSVRQVWDGNIVPWTFHADRLFGYFTAANILGYFMVLGITCCVWRMLYARTKAALWWYPWLSTMMLWVGFLTRSRSALLGLFFALVAMVLTRRSLRKAAYLGIALGSVLFVGVVFSPSMAARFRGIGHNPRLLIWGAYTKNIVSSPEALVVGRGLDSIGRYGSESRRSRIYVPGLRARIGGSGFTSFTDNILIDTTFKSGLAGLLLVLWSMKKTIDVWRMARKSSDRDATAVGALAAAIMTFILVISVFSPMLMTYPWSLLYWMLLGGVLVTIRTESAPLSLSVAISRSRGTCQRLEAHDCI